MSKYQNILNDYDKNHWDMLNKIFDDSIQHIKQAHLQRELEHKIAGVYIVTKIYLNTNDFSVGKITEYIDKFYLYYDQNYLNYKNGFALISDEFDLNVSFYKSFIEKKAYQ